MINQITEKLLKFDEEKWLTYLQELCYDLKPDPSLRPIALELISQLFWIYNELDEINKEMRLLFTKSLLHFLRSIAPQFTNTELIHDIIYFIHEARPIEHRNFIELLIRDESFVGLNFGGDNLHLLLIKAYSYVEDNEKLYLEEYLLKNRFQSSPYFLYVITHYYNYLGYKEKSLDILSKYLTNDEMTQSDEFCKEIYNALTDSIPQYIDLTVFLDYVLKNDIKFDQENSCLTYYIDRFIDDLKTNADDRLVLVAEDILKDQIDNYLNQYEIIGELAEEAKINTLIVKHIRKFSPNFSIPSQVADTNNVSIPKMARAAMDYVDQITDSVN